jgi:hypothetical protein
MTKTRLALLGTLAELHTQPIRYDLAELTRIVADTQPDLLGVEIARVEFERGDLTHAPLEVREALVPIACRSNTVIAPIGATAPDELRAPQSSARARVIRALDTVLNGLQRTANDARQVNSAMVSHACGIICSLEEMTCGQRGRRAWEETNAAMLSNIVAMAQRDPATRILVAVQCRRKHWLHAKLKKQPEIELVNYWEL